ncbi:MAG: hypothetical protein JSS49_03485 [Planctomycetes bacterium]|nr:hypothetical protein [Planctomycetota bacterium]
MTTSLRLEIEPVIRSAERLREEILKLLPEHQGLPALAAGVASAARAAETVSRNLKRPFGIHRLPSLFLAIALILLVGWLYRDFLSVTPLTISLPDRDAQELRDRVSGSRRLLFRPVIVRGSRESAQMIAADQADLAFVQGGLPLPSDLPRLEIQQPEYVLWFLRQNAADASHVRRILTSLSGEGSHTVAQTFMKAWKLDAQVEYVHDWKRLYDDEQYVIPNDIDAVFVVKDPSDDQTLTAITHLARAGFQLRSPDLGSRAAQHDFLKPVPIPAGYLQSLPPFPAEQVQTYAVPTYLVARRNLSPRLLAVASDLINGRPTSITAGSFDANISEASEIFQGVEAFMGILINIALAFFALLGIETMTYRKQFHELNSLVSLISMHQSSKDVLGLTDPKRRQNNLLYLSLCSDLLGLVSSISGYYTQENSSLLFNNLPEIIHQRCDGMKINIQLKILHAMIQTPSLEPAAAEASTPPG